MSKDRTEGEILALIEQEESAAYGINDSALADDRAEAIDYYNGEPFGNEVEGRSQVVSRDVLDTIESALPQLLKVFVSGDRIVQFNPKGPEDEQAAEQETDYINYVITEQNNGFNLFYTWFKDALLSKNGYVKVWYEEENEVETESYQGLTDGQLQMLIQDNNVEVVEHSEYPDPSVQQMNPAQMMQAGAPMLPQPLLHDVKISVSERKGRVKVCNVAPEDIMVSADCREVSVQKCRFVQHRATMCRDEIEEQGWKLPESVGFTDNGIFYEESIARDLYDEQNQITQQDRQEILVRDTYIRIEGELKRIVVAGNSILHEEDAEIVPIACITPHIMPHRHIGMSYADLTKDVQLIKSSLIRGQIDNIWLSLNGRYGVSDRVNLDDMLTSRPGGLVRISGAQVGAELIPIQHQPLPPASFNLVEYFDSVKEKRTGITAYNQGMDADSLNKTATGVSQIMNAAQQRLELVARTFAETGVKELFMLVHRLIRMHYTKPDIVRLTNKWVDIDPRQWKTRTDLTIAVGLGTGNKDQQLAHLASLYQMQMGALQAGIPVVTPENIFNTLKKMVTNAGFRNYEDFTTEPQKVPPKQPQPDPKMLIEQMKLQADAQKFQAESSIRQQESDKASQMDVMKFQAQAEIERQKAEQQWQQEQLRSANDVQIEKEKIMAQAELERYKAELDAETKYKIALLSSADPQTVAYLMNESISKADNVAGALSGVMQMMEDLKGQIDSHRDQISKSQVVAIRRVRDKTGRLVGGVQVRADGTETPIQIQ